MNHVYDPVKIFNKKMHLNEAAIKCRYDLMYINDYYKVEGRSFKNNNLFKNIHAPVFDKDITDFKLKTSNDRIEDLTERAGIINRIMKESNIVEKIDNSDHTSNWRIQNSIRSERRSMTRVSNKDASVSPFYKDFIKIKNKRKKVNLNLAGGINNSTHLNKTQSKRKYTPLPKLAKLNRKVIPSKKRIESGKVPKFGKRTHILLPQMKTEGNIYIVDQEDIMNKTKRFLNEFTKVTINNETELVKNFLFSPEEIEAKRKARPQIQPSRERSSSLKRASVQHLRSLIFADSNDDSTKCLKSPKMKESFKPKDLDHFTTQATSNLRTYDNEETLDNNQSKAEVIVTQMNFKKKNKYVPYSVRKLTEEIQVMKGYFLNLEQISSRIDQEYHGFQSGIESVAYLSDLSELFYPDGCNNKELEKKIRESVQLVSTLDD